MAPLEAYQYVWLPGNIEDATISSCSSKVYGASKKIAPNEQIRAVLARLIMQTERWRARAAPNGFVETACDGLKSAAKMGGVPRPLVPGMP
jgi:hypothetical protein